MRRTTGTRGRPRLRRLHLQTLSRARSEAGFTLVEVLMATLLLSLGMLAVIASMDRSRELVTHAERKEAAIHIGEREMEQIHSRDYTTIGLSSLPTHDTNLDHPFFYVSNPTGAAPTGRYQWDHDDTTGTRTSDMVSLASGFAPGPVTETTLTPGGGTRLTFRVYRVVTWVNDPATTTTTTDYKRISVAVESVGADGPPPLLLTSIKSP